MSRLLFENGWMELFVDDWKFESFEESYALMCKWSAHFFSSLYSNSNWAKRDQRQKIKKNITETVASLNRLIHLRETHKPQHTRKAYLSVKKMVFAVL